MSKQEYMYNLWEALNDYNPEIRDEIVNDYEDHFAMGHQAGKSDDEVIKELGSIDELIKDLKEIYGPGKSSEGSKKQSGGKKEFHFNFDADSFKTGLEGALTGAANALSKGAEKIGQYISNADGDYIFKNVDFDEATISPVTASENCKNLVVETDFGNVEIRRSEDNLVHVYYENKGSATEQMTAKFDFVEKDGTAYVRVAKIANASSFFRNLQMCCVDIGILVPVGFDSITLANKAGDIRVESVDIGNFEYNASAGNVKIIDSKLGKVKGKNMAGNFKADESRIDNVEVHSAAGDIKLIGEFKDVFVKGAAGNVNINGSVSDSINLNSNCGNLDVELERCSGYTAEIESVFGDASFAFGNERRHDKKGTIVFGDGSLKIRCKSQCGNSKVRA